MTFSRPELLVPALLVAILFIWLYNTLQRRKTANDAIYSNVAFFTEAIKPRGWVAGGLQALWLLAFVGLALAVGGPHLGLPVPVRDGNVFICIDTSGSMASTDVVPTRAQAALAAARAFIAESPAGTKIGIIAFAANAEVIAPLSADHAAVAAALEQVPLPNGGTAIGDALQLAATSLPPRGHRVVILVTDGVNNLGVDPNEMAQWLGAHHVPIYTIGIGTTEGGLIPGTAQEATIDESALRGYAQVSGGAYARVENATQLRNALARLGRVTALAKKNVDGSLLFALAGGILAIGAFFIGFGLGRYP